MKARSRPRKLAVAAVAVAVVPGLVLQTTPASAFTYVTDANGTAWGIQDAAPPRADTGSIRATQNGTGQ